MTLSKIDLQLRKDLILAIAVDQYIGSVSPVSSSVIARKYQETVSSATVRHILAELEEDGFLTHPHTSAGRIPTQKGYRYYVDNLMNEIKLLEEEKLRIKNEYRNASLKLEGLFDRTSQILAETTHYTSIISVDGWDDRIFCRGTNFILNYLDGEDLKEVENILMALEEKEQLLEVINQKLAKNVEIYIGQELANASIKQCSLVITSYKTKRGPTGRMAVLGPTRMNYERVVSTLDYLTNYMEEVF